VDVFEALEINEAVEFVLGRKPEPVPALCSPTLRMRLLVTPVYRVFERFVMM